MTNSPNSYSVLDKLNEAYEVIGTASSESEENLLAEEFGELVIQHWPELVRLIRSATHDESGQSSGTKG